MNILITGAAGFVGRALTQRLRQDGHVVTPAVRRADLLHASEGARVVEVGDIDATTDWSQALYGCQQVVHCAARVHVMRDLAADPMAAFHTVNVAGTLNLARQAAQLGVRRLVFLSSIKVNGEGGDQPYTEAQPAQPQDPYAQSKLAAEQGLREVAEQTGLQVVILRPPLIYGPQVGANFRRLMSWVERGIPLPLGSVHNQRSLLYLGNLVDAIALCLQHPQAAQQTYLVCDGQDVSTPQLIRLLAQHLGCAERLLPVPGSCLVLAAKLLGNGAQMSRLLGSLTVDSSKLRRELGWVPPFSLDEGLAETVRWFKQCKK